MSNILKNRINSLVGLALIMADVIYKIAYIFDIKISLETKQYP